MLHQFLSVERYHRDVVVVFLDGLSQTVALDGGGLVVGAQPLAVVLALCCVEAIYGILCRTCLGIGRIDDIRLESLDHHLVVVLGLHGHKLHAILRQRRKMCHLHGVSERTLHLSPRQIDGQDERVPHVVVQFAVQMQHAILVLVLCLGQIAQVGRFLVENQLRVASRSGIIQFEVVYGGQLVVGYSRFPSGVGST